jgi:hypothetical protein
VTGLLRTACLSTLLAAALALTDPVGARADFTAPFDVGDAQSDPEEPHVAVDPDGNVYYVWQAFDSVADENVIRMRRRAADGTLGPIQRLSPSGGHANDPHLAIDPAGNVHFAWDWSEPSKLSELQTRRLAADGTLGPVRTLITASETEGGSEVELAVDDAGNAYFAWVHQNIVFGEPDQVESVRLSAGGALGSVQDLAEGPGGHLGNPAVAVNASGAAAYAWVLNTSPVDATLQGRLRAPDGSLGAARDLATGQSGTPDVAVDPSGNGHFTWARFDGVSVLVQTRRLASDGTLGATQDLSGPGNHQNPQVDVDSAGVATFVWNGCCATRDVEARRRAPDGTLGAIEPLGPGSGPQLAVDAIGNAHFIWSGSGSGFPVRARRWAASGALGRLQELSPETSDVDVAVNEDGFAAAFWSGADRMESALACADADEDALCDDWETVGVDVTGDGTVDLDLPAMGADPGHKDIFIEIDSMAGHALSQAAVDRMVTAFAQAPVDNPDALPGIVLHVDNGPTSTMNPLTGDTWGAQSRSDTLAQQQVLGFFDGLGNYDWSVFDSFKQGNFAAAREPAFHYVISADQYGSAANDSSGISRNGADFDRGASDLLVTLGPAGGGTVSQQAGTLMHELGPTSA